MAIRFERFGGNPTGELQTGAWYKLETIVNDEWQDVKANVDNAVWNSIAYVIKKNDITELEGGNPFKGLKWHQINACYCIECL